MFFTQFPELQEADISCPVIAGDATAGHAGVVSGKQNIQWVEFVLGRSDEYWEG